MGPGKRGDSGSQDQADIMVTEAAAAGRITVWQLWQVPIGELQCTLLGFQTAILLSSTNTSLLRNSSQPATGPQQQRRQWQPTPVLLPGKSHGWRSLVGCSPWGREESDRTERLHFHFSPSCIGEGNGNPLQCSCLQNPRDRGAQWAAVYGVAQSQTRLKRLSSSSSRALVETGLLTHQVTV